MRNQNKKTKPGLVILLSLLGFIVLLLLINEVSFLYWEKDSYDESNLNKLLDERCAPIYLLNDNDKAIMFVHGMPSSPATYIYYSELASDRGYDVIVPLLPGFGTTNTDLYDQTFSGWVKFLSEKYELYRRLYDKFYIVGISMGGSLSLRLAEMYSDTQLEPTAVAVTAAAVFLNNIPQGVILNPALFFVRTIGWFVDEVPGNGASFFAQYPDGGHRWRGYSANFPRQLHSYKMYLKKIKRDLDKITVPLYLAHDINDKTVPYKNMNYIAEHVTSEIVETNSVDLGDIPHSHHILYIYDSTRDLMYEDIMNFFESLDRPET